MRKKFWALMVAVCLLLAFLQAAPAEAASSSELQAQISELEKQGSEIQANIKELEGQIRENTVAIGDLVANKFALDKQVSLITQSISVTQDKIAAYSLLIADKQEELDAAEEKLAELHLAYKDRIRAMEEEGELSFWAVLFCADSFSDFLDRINMIQEIAQADRSRLQEIRSAADLVSETQLKLQNEQAALKLVKLEQEEEGRLLQEKQLEVKELLIELRAKGDAFVALLDASEEDQQKLMEQIAKLEDEYDDAVYQEWLATYVPPTTESAGTSNGQISPSGEAWMTPVPYYTLTSPFGMRLHPILGIERPHNGVDMACAEWTPIYASRGGQVSIATNSDSAGLYVQINHGDGYRSVYMHMVHYVVSAGEFVAQGQVIGYVGNTGLSKGNHLHFGISYNGEYVNPMEYIS